MGESLWMCYLGVLVIAFKVNLSRTIVLDPIYWNTNNTRFIPGEGLVLFPQIGDQMDIVCPRVEGEYYRIYMVTREQLDRCYIPKTDIPLVHCAKPDQDVRTTLKFQEFSPNLWGLEFHRGKDYYIISTSNGTMEGIYNQEGGVCKTKSMKIIMKVGQMSPKDSSSKPPEGEKPNPNNEVINKTSASCNEGETSQGGGSGAGSPKICLAVALFAVVIASGMVIFIIIFIMLVLLLMKYRQRRLLYIS